MRYLLFILILTGFLVNLQSQTPTWNWANSIYTAGTEIATDVAVDASTGDIYVVGSWNSNLSAIFGAGATAATNFTTTYGDADGFVAKYNSAGALQWAFKVGGQDNDQVNAVTVDP